MKYFLLLLLISAPTILPTAFANVAPQATPAEAPVKKGGDYGDTRIESDYTFILPDDLSAETVLDYLKKYYSADSADYLLTKYPKLATRFSDESFVDTYFDNSKWDILNSNSGIRYRARSVNSNPDDRKNGRELIQVKLKPHGDRELYREEIKFPVEHYYSASDALDRNPLYGLVKRDKREELRTEIVDKAHYDNTGWKQILTLQQRRRRTYISKEGNSYMTITVDEVVSKKLWKTLTYTSMEIELGEIAYTSATPEQRAEMEEIRKTLITDLTAKFPALKADSTPKYVRLFHMFEKELPMFKLLARLF